jgi:hypothetical protein
MASEFAAEYDFYKGRILSLVFTDDHLLPPETIRRAADVTVHALPLANYTRIVINPVERGWTPVGHVRAFGVEHKDSLWNGLLSWIKHEEISSELQGDRRDSGRNRSLRRMAKI